MDSLLEAQGLVWALVRSNTLARVLARTLRQERALAGVLARALIQEREQQLTRVLELARDLLRSGLLERELARKSSGTHWLKKELEEVRAWVMAGVVLDQGQEQELARVLARVLEQEQKQEQELARALARVLAEALVWAKEPEQSPAPVVLGASAPMKAKQGAEFTARFVAYDWQREKEVRELLQGLSPRSTVHMGERTCRWLVRARVKVRLTGQFVTVCPTETEFIWEGTSSRAEFDVRVNDDAPDGVVVLKFDLSVNGESVRGPRLDLTITRVVEASVDYSTATVVSPQTAFASYASVDRLRVLDRVDSIRIALGLDVFLDCLSLTPNDRWKPTLEREIQFRNLFLLFWSTPAAESPWVEWEWQTALREKGKEAMQIHPLEYGLTPPEPLQDIHFGDPVMAVREAEVVRRGKDRE